MSPKQRVLGTDELFEDSMHGDLDRGRRGICFWILCGDILAGCTRARNARASVNRFRRKQHIEPCQVISQRIEHQENGKFGRCHDHEGQGGQSRCFAYQTTADESRYAYSLSRAFEA